MTATDSGGQQFCLKWNNYQNNLTNVFEQLLQNEALVDVTLACEGESLKCHKMILSACSPFFQNLFFENPCTHPIVILKDMRWEELKAVIEFMYRGEINVSQNQLNPLLKVAAALKVRGLADVSQKPELVGSLSKKLTKDISKDIVESADEVHGVSPTSGTLVDGHQPRKRRRTGSPEKLSFPEEEPSRDPSDYLAGDSDIEHSASSFLLQELDSPGNFLGDASPSVSFLPSLSNNGMSQVSPATVNGSSSSSACHGMSIGLAKQNVPSVTSSSIPNEMELRPGIVEMIREEERAKLLESSFTWNKGPRNSVAESYQYQLQSAWQKCWNNTSGNATQPLRFRERGPLKSWRPETMAEAIFSVLREGLSLSQAARKFDIPYPTFVLYANRVHNMLGPSADPSNGLDPLDIRPKGRGRPQRILLGNWPEDHVRSVIRAVVFRDPIGREREDFASYSRDGYFNHTQFMNENDAASQPSLTHISSTAPGPSFSGRNLVVEQESSSTSVAAQQALRDKKNFPAETLVSTNSKVCSSQSQGVPHHLHSHLLAPEIPDAVQIKAEVSFDSGDSNVFSMCQSRNPQTHDSIVHQPSLRNPEITESHIDDENVAEGLPTSQQEIIFDNMS